MSINFPDSPSTNELFSVGNRTWQWSGTVWNTVEETVVGPTGPSGADGTDGFSAITVSTLGPTGGTDGDLWIVYS